MRIRSSKLVTYIATSHVWCGNPDVAPEFATALANFGDKKSLEEASQIFQDLSNTPPDEPIYRFNLACAQRDLGDTTPSFRIVETKNYQMFRPREVSWSRISHL